VAFIAHHVVLDPERVGPALDAALSDRELADRVLNEMMPGYLVLDGALRAEIRQAALDPSVHVAAREVTLDPRSGEISLRPIQSEVAAQVSRFGLGNAATNTGDAAITVPRQDLQRYRQARDRSGEVAYIGGVITVVLLGVALLSSTTRLRTLRAIGLWSVLNCAVVGAAYWLAPALILAASTSIKARAAAVVASTGRRDALVLLAPFAVAGVVLVVVSLRRGRQGHTA
jgi:hypothetical protein